MMIRSCFQRLRTLSLVLLLLLNSSQADNKGGNNQNRISKNATTPPLNKLENKASTNVVPVFLPTLELQYVCGYDIRPTFNVTDTFVDLYQTLLPEMLEAYLSTTEKISGMDDIINSLTKSKQRSWHCNAISTEILITMKVKGYALFDRSSPDIARMSEVINHNTVRRYFVKNVCSDLNARAFFVESPFRKETMSNDFDQVHHNVKLLCGTSGEHFIEYEGKDAPDTGFVLFGIFVGLIMVRMVVAELQKYHDNLGDYEGIPSEEVELT